VRVGISAAALKPRRGTNLCVFALCAVALGLVVTASSLARSSATPLVQVKPKELRLSQPLVALAAEGRRAALAFCNQLVGVWRPGSSGVTRLGPVAQWTCPPPRGLERAYSLAFAGDRVAWAASAGGNQYTNLIFLAVLGHPHAFPTIAAQTGYCCRGLDPDPNRMGDVYGDGRFIVFSSRLKCRDLQAPPSCSGQPPNTLVSQSMWRLRRAPFKALCVYQQGPCKLVASVNATLRPLSVSAGRVALLQNGVLEIRNQSGAVMRQFAAVAAVMRGADLMGNRLLVLVPRALRVYNVVTGALVRTRTLPNVTSAGVCGMPPCPVVALQELDAARGLVAYTLNGTLHLLRLRDGRNRIVATATDARFGGQGLFYAYQGAAPWVSRIRFVPWASLPVRP
jgi:hypothetical protein